jgi:hypothetical protein
VKYVNDVYSVFKSLKDRNKIFMIISYNSTNNIDIVKLVRQFIPIQIRDIIIVYAF